MNDGIIKNDGTSRLMRSTLPATYEEFKQACEAGTQPLDVLFNESGWAQLPDFLNKGNLLKDQTAEMFGLNSDSKLNDVFSFLGRYNLHWWRRRLPAGMRYVESKTALNKSTEVVTENHPCYVSKQISINQNTGEITLVSPETITVDGSAGSASTAMRDLKGKCPCYVKLDKLVVLSEGILYLPEGTTTSKKEYDTTTLYRPYLAGYRVDTSNSSSPVCQVVTSSKEDIQAGEWEYLYSSDRSAYPDSGEQDGYEYEYMGIPFDNAVNSPKIETGSYVGTGKYGVDNPNSLTFSFIPKIVWLLGCKGSTEWFDHVKLADNESGVIPCEYLTTKYKQAPPYGGSSAFNYCFSKRSQDKRTIYWYYSNNNRGDQYNSPNTTYYYIAFG